MSMTASTADRAAAAFREYLAGDHPRMAEVVEAATPAMWHTARAIGLDRPHAEDAVQQAWTQLVDNAQSVRDPQSILAWLITTTRRCAIRLAQQTARANPTDDEQVLDRGGDPDGHNAAGRDPASVVLRDEADRSLWRHVANLSPRCRELLRIIAFADKPDYAAISKRLGMPVGSIGPTRGRCLAVLRAALSEDPTWSTP